MKMSDVQMNPNGCQVTLNQKLWKIFLAGLEQVDSESQFVWEILEDVLPGMNRYQLPELSISGTKIICNMIEIEMESSPLVRRLFEAFLGQPEGRKSRAELIQKVYQIKNVDGMSARRSASCQHSIVKLISRARKISESYFVGGNLNNFEWFVYDGNSETWRLVKRKEFLDD